MQRPTRSSIFHSGHMPEGEDELLKESGLRSTRCARQSAQRPLSCKSRATRLRSTTLCEMARRFPSTLEELSGVLGFGGDRRATE